MNQSPNLSKSEAKTCFCPQPPSSHDPHSSHPQGFHIKSFYQHLLSCLFPLKKELQHLLWTVPLLIRSAKKVCPKSLFQYCNSIAMFWSRPLTQPLLILEIHFFSLLLRRKNTQEEVENFGHRIHVMIEIGQSRSVVNVGALSRVWN